MVDKYKNYKSHFKQQYIPFYLDYIICTEYIVIVGYMKFNVTLAKWRKKRNRKGMSLQHRVGL